MIPRLGDGNLLGFLLILRLIHQTFFYDSSTWGRKLNEPLTSRKETAFFYDSPTWGRKQPKTPQWWHRYSLFLWFPDLGTETRNSSATVESLPHFFYDSPTWGRKPPTEWMRQGTHSLFLWFPDLGTETFLNGLPVSSPVRLFLWFPDLGTKL